MAGLRALHASMRGLPVDIQQFRFEAGAVEFACLFSVREAPFVLTLTSRTRTPVFFRFDVQRGYRIDVYLGERYRDLRDLLFVDGRSGKAFEPTTFFAELDRAIPRTARTAAVPTAAAIAQLRHDIEERDRPWFDRWEQRGSGPSRRNLAKTLALLGQEARDFSVEANKSSIWSAVPTRGLWQ
ncbi:DUF6037 family protein [Sphingomonas sp. 2R-10]|uniref:DUF6037 family protein n=1 Tax=Sphingomonas sp. 2R-10 TaxID=3045148 RepID=UPI0019D3186E|nr:DUF6037 family protein [Sphingomonas sp. 2R-10]MDJ0277690.1 DUF6037 family protein [Sphingomonas sp. 2R-10]